MLARLFLKITDVKLERLQDISEEDAQKEGIKFIQRDKYGMKNIYGIENDFDTYAPNAYTSFMRIWANINGNDSWKSNPWVWVYSFEKVE